MLYSEYYSFFAATMSPTDYVGFTFFVGSMAMAAATVFFFMERSQVSGKWKLSMLVSGLITFIAAVHYYYMREFWAENQYSPTALRYIDWTLTVPLMCVEFYLILRAFGARIGLMWRLIFYSVFMLVTGYLGETVYRDNSALWGFISTLGYAGIFYEVWFGSARRLSNNSNDPILQKAFKTLAWFILVGWAIYPIGYMAIDTDGLLRNVIPLQAMDLIYNIGDAVNKIGFGLVIYSLAIKKTQQDQQLRKDLPEAQFA